MSRLEHGEFDRVSLRAFRGVAAKLGVSLELVPRSAGGELDRVLSARHAALGERVAAWIARQPGWIVAAEVSFAIYGERGIVDLLAWHESTSSLVVIELKTAIPVDVDELIGTLDRDGGLLSLWTQISDDRRMTRALVRSAAFHPVDRRGPAMIWDA